MRILVDPVTLQSVTTACSCCGGLQDVPVYGCAVALPSRDRSVVEVRFRSYFRVSVWLAYWGATIAEPFRRRDRKFAVLAMLQATDGRRFSIDNPLYGDPHYAGVSGAVPTEWSPEAGPNNRLVRRPWGFQTGGVVDCRPMVPGEPVMEELP